ncbi:hypothetical protein ACB098_11G131800 [Castanea mollissima]
MKTYDAALTNRPSVLAIEVMCYDNSSMICGMELLRPMRVQSFRTIREEEEWNLIEFISSSVPEGLAINFTEKIIDKSYNCQGSHWEEETFNRSGGFDVPDLFPSLKFLGFLLGTKPALLKMHRKTDNTLNDIINDHKKKRSATLARKCEESSHDDKIDVILKLQETSDLILNITNNHIKAVTLEVFAAGTETTATNPRVMKKAQAEVRQILEGWRSFDEANIQKLDYLKLVVKETLQLHPLGALIKRESREKCEINGYEIPNNTKVIINAWAIGRDTEYWIDADCFRPERFQVSLIDFKGSNFEFIPFGGGRRLLYHFKWKLPNENKPKELDMSESFGLFCRRRNDLYLIATPFDTSS